MALFLSSAHGQKSSKHYTPPEGQRVGGTAHAHLRALAQNRYTRMQSATACCSLALALTRTTCPACPPLARHGRRPARMGPVLQSLHGRPVSSARRAGKVARAAHTATVACTASALAVSLALLPVIAGARPAMRHALDVLLFLRRCRKKQTPPRAPSCAKPSSPALPSTSALRTTPAPFATATKGLFRRK